MKINLFEVLKYYLYSEIEFTKDTTVSTPSNKHEYKKKDRVKLTPPMIWLIEQGKLSLDSFKLCLHQLHQLTNEELREFAAIASNKKVPKDAVITSEGIGRQYTREIHISKEYSVVINNAYEVAIAEKMVLQGVNPVVTAMAPSNQPAIVMWLIQKEQDIFKLIVQNMAFGKIKRT